MKIFNFKSPFILLFFAIAVLFTACNKEINDTEPSSLEDSISAFKTIDVESPPGEFYSQKGIQDMDFQNFKHSLFSDNEFLPDVFLNLDGLISVDEKGTASGSILITSENLNLNAQLKIKDQIIYYEDQEINFIYNPFDLESVQLSSGEKVDYFKVSEQLMQSLQQGGTLTAPQKAVLSILGLSTTDQFLITRDNAKSLISAQQLEEVEFRARDCSWYDYVIAGAVAAPIAIAAAAGCSALTAGCAVGTTVSFGGFAVPCVVLIGGCWGGAFFSTWGAYNYVLDNWLCEQTTCLFSPPSVVWSGNTYNNSVQLNWYSVQGAQAYQVVQWYNGRWNYMNQTTNTSMTINGMSPGGVYYFGVRTVCNNTATANVTWTTVFN